MRRLQLIVAPARLRFRTSARTRNIRTIRSGSSCRKPRAAPPIRWRACSARRSAKEIGQQVIVDDRPGGALTVGLDIVAKSPPDGYTLCMAPIGAMTMAPHLVAHLPYDIARDFQPIVVVEHSQLLLAVSPKTPFHSVKELIDYAKANPGKLLERVVEQRLARPRRRRAVQIHDRHRHRSRALQGRRAGDQRSDGRARAAHVRGLNSIAPFAKSGQVRALAVSGDHRSPAFPDLPTIAEAGVPGYSAPGWVGVIAPAGLPRPILDKLNAAINRAIQSPAFAKWNARIGNEPGGGTPEQFAALIASDSKKWGEVIKRAGIKLE